MIDILLALQQLNEARDALRSSLKRRKEIAIEENDTHYKEIDTTKLFIEGNLSEFDGAIIDIMKRIEHKLKRLEILSWNRNHKL